MLRGFRSTLKLEHFDLDAAEQPTKHRFERFEYDGFFKRPSACGLDVFDSSTRTVAVVTELLRDGIQAENPGTSITNQIEEIAYRLGVELAIDGGMFFKEPKKFILVEHYPQRGDGSTWEEHFDLVRFQIMRGERPTDPQWYRIEKEEVERLIGRTFPTEY